MRLYYEIALRSFRRATAYRSAYIGGILTNAFFGAVRCFVFMALYAHGGSVAGLTLNDAISYTWITQALISIGGGWITDWEITLSIRNGDVVTDLSRPWSFYGYWLSRSVGERMFNLLVRATLTYLIGFLYFGARIPTPFELLAFGAAIAFAMLVSFAYGFMANLSAFWLLESAGVAMIGNIVLMFFSGFLLPLDYFPAPLAALARALPFQAITALPAEVFLGRIHGPALAGTLLLQAFWALVMTTLALLALRLAVRKVVIQGG